MSEESVFVVDIGSSSVKSGYAGDDMPTNVFPCTGSKNMLQNAEVILSLDLSLCMMTLSYCSVLLFVLIGH
jgi:actin-related protein